MLRFLELFIGENHEFQRCTSWQFINSNVKLGSLVVHSSWNTVNWGRKFVIDSCWRANGQDSFVQLCLSNSLRAFLPHCAYYCFTSDKAINFESDIVDFIDISEFDTFVALTNAIYLISWVFEVLWNLNPQFCRISKCWQCFQSSLFT